MMKLKPGLLLRSVGGRNVVVSLEDCGSRLMTLNASGLLLWEQLEAGTRREDLIASLREKYGISEERACADVDGFLQACRDNELLE